MNENGEMKVSPRFFMTMKNIQSAQIQLAV